jgi:hypothetical protein
MPHVPKVVADRREKDLAAVVEDGGSRRYVFEVAFLEKVVLFEPRAMSRAKSTACRCPTSKS